MVPDPTPTCDDATLLARLDRRGRRERALSPDGDRWLTVGDLLDAAARPTLGPGTVPGAVHVPGDDPVAAVTALLTAQAAGAVPVVSPGAPDAALLRRAARVAAGDPGGALLAVVTSGSSGRPRTVVRTAASWTASLDGFDAVLGPDAGPGTVVWAPGPPAATLTLFALWHALATGRPVVAPGAWRSGSVLATGATACSVHCVPAVLADVLAAGAGALPGLRRAVVAGAALPGGTRARAAAAGVGLAEYYGAAELSFVAADADGAGLRAFPGARLDVREGVVWVRSPYLAQGYLDHLDGEGALRRDGAGWATVGDRAALSPEGVLTVHGRGDGTATVGGTTVTLADVERALGGSPGVAEVVALAEPDRRFGERVLVVVRPHPADPLRTAARRDLLRTLRCLARAELPPAARPVRYIVREDLPRSPGGKVARTALAAQVVPATGTAGPDPRTLAP